MHVLLVTNRFDTDSGAGGTEVLTADLADALTTRAVTVTWLVASGTPGTPTSMEPRAWPVRQVRVAVPSAAAPPVGWRKREALAARHLIAALRGVPPVDLVHLMHFSRTGLDFLGHRQMLAIPAVATLTDYTSVCGDFQLVHRHTGRACVPPVSAHMCAACLTDGDSELTRAQEIEAWRQRNLTALNERCHAVWVQTPWQARRLVDAGLHAAQIVGDRAAYAIPRSWRPRATAGGPPTLLFLGRASAEKGLHVLLEAFMGWQRPARLRIVTTPDDGAYERRLRRAASADPRIEWHPPVARDDLIDLLNDADALVVPSQWEENHPMVMQYAMAVGVPVLASGVASLAHLSEHKGVRFVEGYDEVAAWIRAFDGLLDQPSRPTRGQSEQFHRSYEEFLDTTIDVYRKAVGR